MIGILDPALFLPRTPEAEAELRSDLDMVLRTCREAGLAVYTLEEYWPHLWRELGRTLDRGLRSQQARRALDELRKIGTSPRISPLPNDLPKGRVYGFRQLFADLGGEDWTERMTRAIVRAVLSGERTVLLTRRMLGRNLHRHQTKDSVIDEPTRWQLHLNITGRPPTPVLCVHHPRNLRSSLRWTARFDWRLPALQDDAKYPFCPPEQWWKQSTPGVRTHTGKPAWVDAHRRGWARPNINEGRGHHWDVYIDDPKLIAHIGLSQLNIVEFGAPPTEKPVGTIHHVPGKKKPHLRNDSGWSC